MNQDDVEYVLELLEDAIEDSDWDLIEEAKEYLEDSLKEDLSGLNEEE